MDENSVECGMCKKWVHQVCLHMSDDEFQRLTNSGEDTEWFCARCRQIKSNRLKWGEHNGEESIAELIRNTYATIILHWIPPHDHEKLET